jgi:pimeloyl-ACP methyl ester carboxylesterase
MLIAAREEGSRFLLKDGRQLGYLSYGLQQSESIVLFFPGIPGSRFFNPLLLSKSNAVLIRLIVIERPGIGISTPNISKSIVEFPKDVKEFLDGLKIKRVSIIGYAY